MINANPLFFILKLVKVCKEKQANNLHIEERNLVSATMWEKLGCAQATYCFT